jgi:hypothetical protein
MTLGDHHKACQVKDSASIYHTDHNLLLRSRHIRRMHHTHRSINMLNILIQPTLNSRNNHNSTSSSNLISNLNNDRNLKSTSSHHPSLNILPTSPITRHSSPTKHYRLPHHYRRQTQNTPPSSPSYPPP